ncbi:MAG: 7-carboxy-7-deazaguanine synthase QueE [Opitutales bacterium]
MIPALNGSPSTNPGTAAVEPRLPVHETFPSFQGEGRHTGRKAFFVRLFGCPVHCPWCDSAGTWHPDHIPARVERLSPADLAEEAKQTRPDFVVITGGEPTIHDLRPLTEALHGAGLEVHLETSGAFRIRGRFDWVTVSPKRWKAPLPESLQQADEFKLIIDESAEVDRWRGIIPEEPGGPDIWLHPEWAHRKDQQILQLIARTVAERGAPYRAGWQIHKLYDVR